MATVVSLRAVTDFVGAYSLGGSRSGVLRFAMPDGEDGTEKRREHERSFFSSFSFHNVYEKMR